MKRKVEKEENTFTKKQIITMIVCTLIIILVCIFMYKENNKLISEHPEYSVQGVSNERRDTAEKLLNSILSSNGKDAIKLSDDRIYSFQGNEFRKEVFYGDISNDLKLLVALENTLTESFNGTLPDDVKSNSDCITLYDSEISDCISEMVKVDKTINVEKLKETYKNMFSSEIEDYASVSNIHNEYIYSRITNRYYVNEFKSNSTSSKIYYVYYKNYNSPYEHVDLATVDVSVLCVELEGNGKLYKVSDIFGNLIKEHLSESDINTYVRNIKNYDLSTIHVTYKFDNNSTYGLTLSSIDKESN